jgi:hypothetical protein
LIHDAEFFQLPEGRGIGDGKLRFETLSEHVPVLKVSKKSLIDEHVIAGLKRGRRVRRVPRAIWHGLIFMDITIIINQ